MNCRPAAELVTIGTELLTGSTVNTNAAYLGRELTRLGFKVEHQVACPDEPYAIQSALREALSRSKVIFVSGGLGPTPDDVTRECIADFFGVPLVFSNRQYRKICRHYRFRGKKVPALVKREAYFPSNAEPVLNQFGIALGFVIEEKGSLLIVVPGVPGELTRLFETRLRNFLRKKFPGLGPAQTLVVKTIGVSEPTIMKRLGTPFFSLGPFQFGIYPETGEVSIRIYADSSQIIQRVKRRILRTLDSDVYSFSDETLEAVIGRRLQARRWTISVAESCTGGRIAEKITSLAGASSYFKGGVVAYHNDVKMDSLGVDPSVLTRSGAVSQACAVAMARGVRRRMETTLGLAVTGIAGPTRGSSKKPVGLVCIAVADAHRSQAWEERFGGDREQIQTRAAKKALEYLWRWIEKKKSARF